MTLLDFHLFRAKFVKSAQSHLFSEDITPRDIFLRSIAERPSLETAQEHNWHIGNVELLGETAGYFAVGRTTKAIVEKFDTQQGNFLEEVHEESPYTHVLFDAHLGLMAIAHKARLSPTVNGIARKTQQLLSATTVVKELDVEVEIDFLRDPQTFLALIDSAYRISRFSASFGGPNPFDADEYFQKPLSVYLRNANGKKGAAVISGENLDCGTLHDVTVGVAATGNNASARVQKRKGGRFGTIHLGENQITVTVKEADFDKGTLLDEARAKYKAVRDE